MGLCVELQSDSHEMLARVTDERNLLGSVMGYPDAQAFPMLASIDCYGDTTFNCMQKERLLNEWETLFARAKTLEERDLLAAVREIIRRSGVHEYVVFIGD